MSDGVPIFKKTPTALGFACLVGGSLLPAQAASWSKGDWSATFDSNFSLGTSIRTEDIDFSRVGNSKPEA